MLENDRIRFSNNGELPSNGYLFFTAKTERPSEKLNLVKEVMLILSKYNDTNWPIDSLWDVVLPIWFLEKIKSHTLEEIENKSWLWDYGSWLDAMKYRGWQWYSSRLRDEKFEIVLDPLTLPFSVDPLEYLIYESGVDINSISFSDNCDMI